MSKRIGLFMYGDVQAYPPTVNAANILNGEGYEVFVVHIPNPTTPDKIEFNNGIKILKLKSFRLKIFGYGYVLLKLLFLSKKNNLQCLISYDSYSVLPAFLCKKLLGINWAYHQHDFWEKPIGLFQKVLFKLEYLIVPKADIISFPQTQRAEIFKFRCKKDIEYIIVHNGPRLRWSKYKSNHDSIIKKPGEYYLIYQGGIASVFGLKNLIYALNLCENNIKLVLVGKELEIGFIKQIKLLISELSLEDRVFFNTEYIPYDQLHGFTSQCTIGISKLTIPESSAPINDRFLAGASNKLIEYLAAGLPIILAESTDNIKFFASKDVGEYCDVSNYTEIAKAIKKIIEDNDRLLRISQDNQTLFDSYLNFDKQFGIFLKALYQLEDKN